ncbi:MAG: 2-phosphosulfolactate phosphatase [Planctomycetota bacterium]
MKIDVHQLPALVEPEAFRGTVAVVIDALRATTTVCHALAAGAVAVEPFRTVDEARARREAVPDMLLGGERRGVIIDGFDLGNSPTSYTPAAVGGRTVGFTTTNGTKALWHAAAAEVVFAGSFCNATAVADAAFDAATRHGDDAKIAILCAGSGGVISWEDTLCAGLIVTRLNGRPDVKHGNDESRLAAAATLAIGRAAGLDRLLTLGRGGRHVVGLGLEADIAATAAVDSVPLVPVFDAATGRIKKYRTV